MTTIGKGKVTEKKQKRFGKEAEKIQQRKGGGILQYQTISAINKKVKKVWRKGWK